MKETVAAKTDLPVLATGGLNNGRWWENMTDEMKLAYVLGLGDGIFLGKANYAASYETISWPFSLSYGEIQNALDDFYEEPANALIGIPIAMFYVKAKARGDSKDELEKLVAAMRRIAAMKHSDQPKPVQQNKSKYG